MLAMLAMLAIYLYIILQYTISLKSHEIYEVYAPFLLQALQNLRSHQSNPRCSWHVVENQFAHIKATMKLIMFHAKTTIKPPCFKHKTI